MNDLGNAFGLRWLQDDERGRLIYGAGTEYKSAAEAIRSLGLGCDEAALQAGLDKYPPHLRLHGGYTASVGDPATRFTLTWDPAEAEAGWSQSVEHPDEGMSGSVDVPPGTALKDVLRGLLIPDAQDVVEQAIEDGRSVSLKGVDFWIGDQHFRVSDEDVA
jgi:hypothetical protein